MVNISIVSKSGHKPGRARQRSLPCWVGFPFPARFMTSPQASASQEQDEDLRDNNVSKTSPKSSALASRVAALQELMEGGARRLKRWPLLSWTCVAASLIGCQSLVTSGLNPPRIAVMLPFGPGDEQLRRQFLRGFTVGEDSVKASVTPPPSSWFGSPDTSPSKFFPKPSISSSCGTARLICGRSELAKARDLSVLLPFQRGSSLGRLAGLEGSERLWPLVPSRRRISKLLPRLP